MQRSHARGQSKKALRQVVELLSLAGGIKVVGMAAGYVFSLAVAKWGGAEAWGAFSLCLMLITVASILGRLGLDTAALRLIAEHRAQGNFGVARSIFVRVTKVVAGASAGAALILIILAPYLDRLLFDGRSAHYIRLASFAVPPTAVLLVCAESLRASRKIKEYLSLNLVLRYIAAALLFALLVGLFGVNASSAAVTAYAIGVTASAFIAWRWATAVLDERTGNQININVPLRTIFGISLPLLLASSMQFIKGYIDTIMLGIYLTPADVGVYNVAFKLAAIVGLPLMAVNTFTAPRFAELHGLSDREGLGQAVQRSSQLVAMIAVPCALLMVIVPDFVLGVFGKEFTVAVPVLRILIVGALVNAVSGSVGYFLQMTGGHKFFQHITITAAVIGVVLNIALVPIWGMVGAAVSTAISATVWNVGSVIYVKKRYGITTVYVPLRARTTT